VRPRAEYRIFPVVLAGIHVLHISKCLDRERDYLTLSQRTTPLFPCLVKLRLHQCTVPLGILQGVIDAAPHLAALCLDEIGDLSRPTCPPIAYVLRLQCSKVTNLVLANLYCWDHECQNTMEVDAPLLRYFTYQGPI
jgi:hypothetical protein